MRSCRNTEAFCIVELMNAAIDVERSMQAGLNAHLSKPVEPEVLLDTLEKLIKKYLKETS